MAAGSVTVAALRHRPRQAVLVVTLAAVITAVAVVGVLYARAVEQSILRSVVADAPVQRTTLVVSASGQQPASPGELKASVRGSLPRQFARPIGGAEAQVQVPPSDGGPAVLSRLMSRDRLCQVLQVLAGRCVRRTGEVLLSRAAADDLGVGVGDQITVTGGGAEHNGVRRTLTVVGLHDPINPTDAYWSGRGVPPTVPPARSDTAPPRTIDDIFTTWATLNDADWPGLRTHVDIPLGAARLNVDDLAGLRSATEDVDQLAGTVGGSATGELNDLLASTDKQRDQARTVIPLLAVQLAVLGVVVLAFVCAAATEQRRPEIALARLRGHGTRGATGMLLRELGLLIAAGAVLGTALGWIAALGATKAWLAPGVSLEARLPVVLAALAGLSAGLLAIVAAATPTLRQPLTALLRRIPPRSSTLQVGLVEGAAVAAAAAGLVTALSGDRGPVALLAPGLLAIAGGLLLAQAAIPTAGPLARGALRGGRLPWALAGLQIARRPALRRLIAIVTVACALLVFAVDAWMVAGRNRDTRAAVEAGAPVVLDVDADSPQQLRRALLDIDPHGRFATPVVTTHSAAPVGPVTTAVEPAAFRRIAQWAGHRPSVADTAALSPERVAPVRLPPGPDLRIAVTATYTFKRTQPPSRAGEPRKNFRLSLGLKPAQGEAVFADLGRLREGPHIYSARVTCARCSLSEFDIFRKFELGNPDPVSVRLQIDRVEAGPVDGARVPVDLGPPTPASWQVVPDSTFVTSATVHPGPPLTIEDPDAFGSIDVRRGNAPPILPAIATGSLSKPFGGGPATTQVLAPDLSGLEQVYEKLGRLPVVPRSGPRGVLTDLRAAAATASAPSSQTTYAVWLADDDDAKEQALRRELTRHGLLVLARDTTADHVANFDHEGPSLALRLALLAGVVAVALAAAVLVVGVATSGTSRARDLAALRVVGVPAATVRRASVREHLIVALAGVIAGGVLGLVAAQAALPQVPLFATRSARLPLDLAPAWTPVIATIVGCLGLLAAVSVVVGRGLAASALPSRLRDAR